MQRKWPPVICLFLFATCVLEAGGLRLGGFGGKPVPSDGAEAVDVSVKGGKGSLSADLRGKAGSAKTNALEKVEAKSNSLRLSAGAQGTTLARFLSTSWAMQRVAVFFLIHSLIQAIFVIQRKGLSWVVVPHLIGCCTIECCYAAIIFSAARVFDRYEDESQVPEALETQERLFNALKVLSTSSSLLPLSIHFRFLQPPPSTFHILCSNTPASSRLLLMLLFSRCWRRKRPLTSGWLFPQIPLLIKLLLMVLSVVNNSFSPRLLQRFLTPNLKTSIDTPSGTASFALLCTVQF